MLTQIKNLSTEIQFKDIIAYIDAHYDFEPCAFLNGDIENATGQNSGSCKVFQFAIIEDLTKEQTLTCFGEYYQVEVLQNLEGSNHQNIRNFIMYGFDRLKFETLTLTKKQ
jgi:hypothetical protein